MTKQRYIMSFTAGGLFHRESVKLALLHQEHKDWSAVRKIAISDNVLQTRTVSTLKRLCREIISRLKTLSTGELDFLLHATPQEQAYILWLAVCRRHRFIAEFAIEVLRERYITLKTDLSYEDFDSFFNRKSEWHDELDSIRPATRNKLRQVLFRMLREADLLTADNAINPVMLSVGLLEVISHGGSQDVSLFPTVESDLRGIPK